MMKWACVALVVLGLSTLVQAQRGPRERDGSRTCTTQMWAAPDGLDSPPASAGAATALTPAGLVHCSRFTAQCTITATGFYWRIQTGAASQVSQVGIYNSAGTTLIAASAIDASAASTTNHSSTGLTPFTLIEGTEYLACQANSGTTVAFYGNSSGIQNLGAVNVVVNGQNADANKAQFNADCSGAGAPVACCTGVGTGTCAGLPTSLGTLSTGLLTFAYIVLQ